MDYTVKTYAERDEIVRKLADGRKILHGTGYLSPGSIVVVRTWPRQFAVKLDGRTDSETRYLATITVLNA